MSILSYKCPCCGAPLAFSAEQGQLACASCGNTYEVEALEALNASRNEERREIDFSMNQAEFDREEAGEMRAYTCQFCGAELLTEASTSATECAFCGSPAILPAQMEGSARPEQVIPFRVTQEQATDLFHGYFKGKRLLPKVFLTSKNRISEIRKLYVPYWLFSCQAQADITYDAEKVETTREGEWEIRRTRHYLVRRSGTLDFDGIPVDGCARLDNRITESLEPYDFAQALPFSPAVLAGAMADNADVDAENCRTRAVERLESSTQQVFRDTVEGYDKVSVRRCDLKTEHGRALPVLLPVWLLTTDKQEGGEKKTYTFAINGQTGALTCDVPYAKGKALAWFGGLFAGICLAGYALLVLLQALGVMG